MIAALLVLWSAMVHGSAARGFQPDLSQNMTALNDFLQMQQFAGFANAERNDKSGTLTLDPGSCQAWSYTAITQNVVGISIKPTDFPTTCTPEEHLFVAPHFYTVGDCAFEDCENDEGRLMKPLDLCSHIDDVMVPFVDNAHGGTKKFVVHKGGPICSEEKKALYAVGSKCPHPVEVYFEFDSELAEHANKSCDGPWGKVLGIGGGVLAAIMVLALKCGCVRCRRAPRVAVVAVPSGFQMAQRHAPTPARQPSERPPNEQKPAGSDSQDGAQAHSENVPLLTATLR